MTLTQWLTKNCPSLEGKTVAVTGATGGLGRELCRGILFLKGKLILLNRSREKTEALQKALLAEFPRAEIAFLPLDLTDFSSVQSVCSRLSAMGIDILLHNAGIYDVPRFLCSTGLLNVFQVNFAAPYYMTCQLLPGLETRRGKVVVVGSIAHRYSSIDPEDPDFRQRTHSPLIYGNSKRYLMFATEALMAEHPDAQLAICHPGITLTNISNHYPAWLYPLIKPFLFLLFAPPKRACRSILYGLTHEIPAGSWVGPGLFDIWGNPKIRRLTGCSAEEQAEISRLSRKMYQALLSGTPWEGPEKLQ